LSDVIPSCGFAGLSVLAAPDAADQTTDALMVDGDECFLASVDVLDEPEPWPQAPEPQQAEDEDAYGLAFRGSTGLPIGAEPDKVCRSASGPFVYVVSETDGLVYVFVITAGGLVQQQTLPVQGTPTDCASFDGVLVVTVEGAPGEPGVVYVFSEENDLVVVGTFPAGVKPKDVDVSPNGVVVVVNEGEPPVGAEDDDVPGGVTLLYAPDPQDADAWEACTVSLDAALPWDETALAAALHNPEPGAPLRYRIAPESVAFDQQDGDQAYVNL